MIEAVEKCCALKNERGLWFCDGPRHTSHFTLSLTTKNSCDYKYGCHGTTVILLCIPVLYEYRYSTLMALQCYIQVPVPATKQ